MALSHSFPDEFPCPICGELRPMRPSKKEKPYLICESCGVQVFIRGKWGILQLSELKNNSALWEKIHSLKITDSCNLLKLNRRICLLNEELKKIEGGEFIFESKENKERKNQLRTQLKTLERAYHSSLLGKEIDLPKTDREV